MARQRVASLDAVIRHQATKYQPTSIGGDVDHDVRHLVAPTGVEPASLKGQPVLNRPRLRFATGP